MLDEHRFLLQRQLHGDSSWVGASSDAMLIRAIIGAERPGWMPGDLGDLGRCEETYRRAPKHLQERMLPTLELFRRKVAAGGLWCYACDDGGHGGTWSGLCEKHAAEAGIDTRPPWVRDPKYFNRYRDAAA